MHNPRCEMQDASQSCIRQYQYKSSGLSFNVPVAGSTSKPKDSKTTTPSKTLSIKSEIQTGKASSFPFSFVHALPLFSSLRYQPMRLALQISSSQGLIFQLLSTNVPFLSLVNNIGNAYIKTSPWTWTWTEGFRDSGVASPLLFLLFHPLKHVPYPLHNLT